MRVDVSRRLLLCGNSVKVWSSRRLRKMSLVELTEIINGETRVSE
jgi:hypothetical protein